MVLALLVSGLVVALVVVGLFVFGLRRRLIQRSGGTFDCSLRWDVPGRDRTSPARAGCTASPATAVTGSSGSGSSRTPRARAALLERSAIEVRRPPRARGRGGAGPALRRRRARLSPPRDPPGAGDERGRADRLPRLAGGGAARPAGECRVDKAVLCVGWGCPRTESGGESMWRVNRPEPRGPRE